MFLVDKELVPEKVAVFFQFDLNILIYSANCFLKSSKNNRNDFYNQKVLLSQYSRATKSSSIFVQQALFKTVDEMNPLLFDAKFIKVRAIFN